MRERRWIVLGCLGVLLAGCGGGGGSGSTGLVTSEDTVIDEVRRTGTCDTFEGAPYCATDSPEAVAPGGQSVSVVTATPTPLPTSIPVPTATFAPTSAPTSTPGAQPTATPGGGSTATPEPGPTATPGGSTATPEPGPTATPGPSRGVTLQVDGFDAGAACATAGRAAGSDDPWQTAALVALDDDGAPVTFPVPLDVEVPMDLALLCFEEPPALLEPELTNLTDADPTVVFVLPSP